MGAVLVFETRPALFERMEVDLSESRRWDRVGTELQDDGSHLHFHAVEKVVGVGPVKSHHCALEERAALGDVGGNRYSGGAVCLAG